MKKVLIIGDVHGCWGQLNKRINQIRPDYTLCCGDFGYWPDTRPMNREKPKRNEDIFNFNFKFIKPQTSTIHWCDGNHEHYHYLIKRTSDEIVPNCIYQPRGSVVNIEGKNFLFFGGADSTDQFLRTPGVDWFPEENITQKDLDVLDKINVEIFAVISHTCPNYFEFNHDRYDKARDANRIALDIVFNKVKPQYWFYGHWHMFRYGMYKQCKWFGLDMLPYGNEQKKGIGIDRNFWILEI